MGDFSRFRRRIFRSKARKSDKSGRKETLDEDLLLSEAQGKDNVK